MHLHFHLTAPSSLTAPVAKDATASAISGSSSTQMMKDVSSDAMTDGTSNWIGKIKSRLISPISMAMLQAGKQSLLTKRGYVDTRSSDIVDLCICLASLLGTMTIIIPYCFSKKGRKLRHSLILGLATSDLVSSLIIIATTSYSLAGNRLANASKFCTFAGFIFSSSLWTQHQWNLSIATITYMILVHPLSSFVSNVERHMIWLWPVFWSIAFIANGIAWRYVGFSDVDGYCTYNANRGGEYFSAIFNFVPRACVSIVILVLYTHLFFFLRRTNLFSNVSSNTNTPAGRVSSASNGSKQRNRSRDRNGAGNSSQTDSNRIGSVGRAANNVLEHVKKSWSMSAPPTPKQSSLAVTTDTDSTNRNGSASSQGKSSVTPLLPPTQPQNVQIQIGGNHHVGRGVDQYAGISPKSKAWTSEELAFQPSEQQELHQLSSSSNSRMKVNNSILQRPSTATLSSSRPKAPRQTSRRPMTAPNSNTEESGSEVDLESLSESERRNDLGIYEALSDFNSGMSRDDGLFKPMTVRRDNRDFGMTSPPQEHLRHVSLSPAGVKLAKKALAETITERNSMIADELAVLPTTTQINMEAGGQQQQQLYESSNEKSDGLGEGKGGMGNEQTQGSVTYEDLLKPDWQWGMAVQQNGGSAKLEDQQQQQRQVSTSHSNRRRSSRFQFWPTNSSGERGLGTNSFGSSTEENGVEALGSTLNRQASVLMLLYPAAYVLLFSISIVRILVDISNTASGSKDPMRNSDALHSVARWSIFAQGAIDAIVFMLIERQFRLRMRRKRRIAAGEKVEDVWLIRLLKKKKCTKNATKQGEKEGEKN